MLSTQQIAKFVEDWSDPENTVDDLADEWGRPPGTLYRWAHELGVKRPARAERGAKKYPLEALKKYCESIARDQSPALLALKSREVQAGAPLEAIVMLSDLHAGRKTKSFNSEVLHARLRKYTESIITTLDIYRSAGYAVNKIHLFVLGDFVSGEKLGKNIHFEELEEGVLQQVFYVLLPALTSFGIRLKQEAPELDIHCVKGNHGMSDKWGPTKTANWDTVAYYGWEAKIGHLEGINFTIEIEDWCLYATVANMTWLLMHGEDVAGGSGSASRMEAKVSDWESSLDPFDEVACGHFHIQRRYRKIFVNGTLITDDEWVRKRIGMNGDCGQTILMVGDSGILGIHPVDLTEVHDDSRGRRSKKTYKAKRKRS